MGKAVAVDFMDRRQKMVLAAQRHFDADMLVKGSYGNEDSGAFKGCSVGCLAHEIKSGIRGSVIHKTVADYIGVPEWLVLLQDTIFEGLPNGPKGENSRWHVQLAEAVAKLPADYDWGLALHRVHVAILRISYRTAGSAQEAVRRVLDLHERAGRGEDISSELWSAAKSAAKSAAWGAAKSAAKSAAWSAAESAAESAAWSAAKSAAKSAAESAAWSAAKSAAWSAAESAAESAAKSAAKSAAYLELRDGILDALREPALAA